MAAHLSERLRRIAEEVPTGARLVDVGTDHALLPIHLAQSGKTSFAVATDIAEGPYRAAMQNVLVYGLEHLISVRLGNGLETVEPGEVDVIVIAGMGGGTAVDVLRQRPEVVRLASRIIVQPMNASGQARRYFHEAGMMLGRESVFYDGDRLYEMIVVDNHAGAPVDTQYNAYSDDISRPLAYEFGPICLKDPTPAFVDHLRATREKWLEIARSLLRSHSATASLRRHELMHRIAWLNAWIESHTDGSERNGDGDFRS